MGIISCNPEVKTMTTIHLPKDELIWENAVRKSPSLSTQLKNSVNSVISVLPCSHGGGKLFTSMENNSLLIEFNVGVSSSISTQRMTLWIIFLTSQTNSSSPIKEGF